MSPDGAPAHPGTVYVVVLNWNGWRDTIACVESVLQSRDAAFQVVVCDNGSTDESMARLLAWADGVEGGPPADAYGPLGDSVAPAPKPVPYAILTRRDAEDGGSAACDHARVVFVQNGANLGYAGGCNVGLRYALARGDCAYAWLLNNDTVVDAAALAALVRRAEARPDAGLCGARVLYFDDPARVQSWGGGRHNPWLGTVRRIGEGAPAAARPDVAAVERETDYVSGASALVTARYLAEVGLMDESYFLYFEELDWAVRGRAFARAYADDAVVYHREGRSTGASMDWRRKSALSDYYTLHNRLLFTRRFFPWALPTVYCGLVGTALNRLLRRQFPRARMVFDIARGRGRPPLPPRPAARTRTPPHGLVRP